MHNRQEEHKNMVWLLETKKYYIKDIIQKQ